MSATPKRKPARPAASVERALIGVLIENLPVGLLFEDAGRRIAFANSALCRMFSIPFSPVDLPGKKWGDLVKKHAPAPSDGDAYCDWAEAWVAQRKAVLNEKIKFSDGHTFDFCYIPIIAGGAGVVGHLWQCQDATEREDAALQMRLLQTQKMASLGQLSSGLIHEMNNPLGIILGFAQSALSRLEDNHALRLPLETIERESRRCRLLMQEALAFSRAGKLEKEACDLNQLLSGTLDIVTADARTKSVEIVRELAAGLPAVPIHRTQIQQVLINLCNNAIDAMPEGGTLTVRAALVRKGRDDYLEVQVQDSGTGIPKAIRDKIFQPFYTTKEIGRGTGLGLSLVADILKKHDGGIELESEEGKGTLFRFFLPLRAPARPNKKRRILVVDDEPAILESLQRLLAQPDVEVLCADDGLEALRLITSRSPDLVILDVNLPGLDGAQICQLARSDATLEKTKILAISGDASRLAQNPALNAWIDGFLKKPFTLEELQAKISSLLI